MRLKEGSWPIHQNALLVAFLVIVACSNPVAHIPEINPEQLAKRVNQPPPTELTYKMVPYDLITIRFTLPSGTGPQEDRLLFVLTGTLLWTG